MSSSSSIEPSVLSIVDVASLTSANQELPVARRRLNHGIRWNVAVDHVVAARGPAVDHFRECLSFLLGLRHSLRDIVWGPYI